MQWKTMAGLVAGWIMAGSVQGAEVFDWPQFRGANRDGISKETQWNPRALQNGAKLLWTAQLGKGYSAVAVKGDRLFTMGNKDNQDRVYALSLKDGKVLWTHSYPCDAGSYPGTRATPATDGSLVYTLSREGLLLCLDAGTGAVKWSKDLMKEFDAKPLGWGFAGSPVIKGDKILVNAGEYGVVLNRNTGAKVWASPGGVAGYAAPVEFTLGGKECLALFSSKGLYGVDLATGTKLWSYPWHTSYDVNAADPIVSDGRIFISSGYNSAGAVLDVRGPEPKVVWNNKAMKNHFSSCVLLNGFLYGFDGNAGNGTLKCVDFNTGVEKWSQKIGFGSLCVAAGHLIALNEKGDLFIIKASPEKYEAVSVARKVLEPTCWTAPVLCRGVVHCRNHEGVLVAVDLGK
ncbi:MAG: PQQ-binding-like beta-propeller repeat protein [bacterium]